MQKYQEALLVHQGVICSWIKIILSKRVCNRFFICLFTR